MKTFFRQKKFVILLIIPIGFFIGYFTLNTNNQTPSRATTTITISTESYSNDIRELPPIKSKEEILAHQDIYKKRFTEQIEEYGVWATRFLTSDTIESLEELDIDSDGKSETIIGLCSLGGNHCPHEIIIVRDEKIVFTAYGSVSTNEILPSNTPNGFVLKWANHEQENQGFAQPTGYMKTRFEYKDGKFVPVEEKSVQFDEVKEME